MILKAFSQYLQSQPIVDGKLDKKPELLLYHWLLDILSRPPQDGDVISRIVHAEVTARNYTGHLVLEGKGTSGRRLLSSLLQFCRSYDHWQFSRWLHDVRASDFNERKYGS